MDQTLQSSSISVVPIYRCILRCSIWINMGWRMLLCHLHFHHFHDIKNQYQVVNQGKTRKRTKMLVWKIYSESFIGKRFNQVPLCEQIRRDAQKDSTLMMADVPLSCILELRLNHYWILNQRNRKEEEKKLRSVLSMEKSQGWDIQENSFWMPLCLIATSIMSFLETCNHSQQEGQRESPAVPQSWEARRKEGKREVRLFASLSFPIPFCT